MPIYVVRWPNLSAALVRAESEDHLIDLLDELADPGGCKWEEYDGPLWVEFELPVTFDQKNTEGNRPLSLDDLEITEVDARLIDAPKYQDLRTPETDTGAEMHEAVCKFAFPALYAVKPDDKGNFEQGEIRRALLEDLRPLVEGSWRDAAFEKRTDPDAVFMKLARITRRIPGIPLPSDFENGDEGEDEDE